VDGRRWRAGSPKDGCASSEAWNGVGSHRSLRTGSAAATASSKSTARRRGPYIGRSRAPTSSRNVGASRASPRKDQPAALSKLAARSRVSRPTDRATYSVIATCCRLARAVSAAASNKARSSRRRRSAPIPRTAGSCSMFPFDIRRSASRLRSSRAVVPAHRARAVPRESTPLDLEAFTFLA